MRSATSAAGVPSVTTAPSIAPRSRRWRTSARVSISSIAGTPAAASQSSSPLRPSGAALRAARQTSAAACTPSDSPTPSSTP